MDCEDPSYLLRGKSDCKFFDKHGHNILVKIHILQDISSGHHGIIGQDSIEITPP